MEMPKIKSRPARIATSARNASHNEAGGQSVAGREKTKKQPKEDLRKTKEELSIQKWGLEKTLGGMKALVKEIIQKEKELKETNKKLEQVDQAKSEFISLASHQLKTPPTAIKVLTERLLGGKMGKFTEKQKEYLSDICFSNQRMIDIVNTL